MFVGSMVVMVVVVLVQLFVRVRVRVRVCVRMRVCAWLYCVTRVAHDVSEMILPHMMF